MLLCYNDSFNNLVAVCEDSYDDILRIYRRLSRGTLGRDALRAKLDGLLAAMAGRIYAGFSEELIPDRELFMWYIREMVIDKMQRTIKNNLKIPFSAEDLKNNLITGFTSGYYMYFRSVYNDISLGRIRPASLQYEIANFCFIREYCYGSMFRYNARGEFNIPYGGMSYNTKNFKSKIDNMFNENVRGIFANTEIYCADFETFMGEARLTANDFMFLDPPYDTDFSDYEGRDFTKRDQERLARVLTETAAQFILVIKNTDFIYSLYKDKFNILSFDNRYAYNMRSRNERNVKHLLITNLPVGD
ncbi:MAG: DNA adenine methylase [Roseburia sp.]|nr:DNA adenine methylase [Roseburia sp.]